MPARNSRPCSRAHAAATYATDHCTTLRRRSLVQMLSTSRPIGVSVIQLPPCASKLLLAPFPTLGDASLLSASPSALSRRLRGIQPPRCDRQRRRLRRIAVHKARPTSGTNVDRLAVRAREAEPNAGCIAIEVAEASPYTTAW